MGADNWSSGVERKRNAVFWKSVFSDNILENCFGYVFLDWGHKRVPVPPANNTGIISLEAAFMNIPH